MTEDGGHGGSIMWGNHSWAFSNSDNSGGRDEKSGKKPLESSSNNPAAAVAPPAVTVGQKRGRNGVPKIGRSGRDCNECKGEGADCDHDHDHEMHIWTERERRKKMRSMFSNLHNLLPQLPAKADKSTIVDEAVNYIKTLEHTLQKLQKKRLDMLRGETSMEPSSSTMAPPPVQAMESRESFMANQGCSNPSKNQLAITTNSPNSLEGPRFPIFLQTWSSLNIVLSVFGNDAQICICTPKKSGLFATLIFVLEKHKLEVVTANISSDHHRSMYMIHAHANGAVDQFPKALTMEEIFKLAVGEMIFWLTS